jgi:NitT/TauT family transport system ATP-binding protein
VTAQALIRFDHVATSFEGATVYRDLGFTVGKSEFVCLLGPSGCGKSTALRLLGGLMQQDSGTITVDGKPPAQAWPRMAFVFQSPRLAPWRTALDNVLLGMQLRRGRVGPPDREKARDLLKLVGLGDDAEKYPRMLSGGERQRVAIARALGVDPDIILMDEPFSALDPNTRLRLRAELIDIWRRTRKTILFVTHDVDEALSLADRILLFSNKPTSVVFEMTLPAARPRDVRTDAGLQAQRDDLLARFHRLETHSGEAP